MEVDWNEVNWEGVDWIEVDWEGVDWVEVDWVGFEVVFRGTGEKLSSFPPCGSFPHERNYHPLQPQTFSSSCTHQYPW